MTTAVYIVRPGPNEELRYSLRSVEANLPEITDVVIVGHAEPWLRNVTVIPGNPHRRHKRMNVWANVYTAATHPDLPDDIVLMNDDFMVMRPAVVGMAYRCGLLEHIGQVSDGWWRRSLLIAANYLVSLGIREPLSYELHRPFPMNRRKMAQVMDECSTLQPENPPQWRTIYGNRWRVGGVHDQDVKVYSETTAIPEDATWLSTNDGGGFEVVAPLLARMFPEPSRWEQ